MWKNLTLHLLERKATKNSDDVDTFNDREYGRNTLEWVGELEVVKAPRNVKIISNLEIFKFKWEKVIKDVKRKTIIVV